MDKKILSTAIAGVLAGSMAFAANADVTLYGQLDVSIDSVDVDGFGDDVNMESNYSAIGVKGSEDLGNGLKAIFMVEYQTDLTEGGGAGGVSGRDRWIGLDGAFGKMRFGAMSTTYKASGAMIDPLWRTAFDSRDSFMISGLHGGNGGNGEGRTSNAIAYDTPDFNGLSASATYSFDDDCGVGAAPGCVDDDTYSLGARYNNGPLLVFADYITTDTGGNDDAYKLGGRYSFGDFAVFGQYEFDGGMVSAATEQSVNNIFGLALPLSGEEDADRWYLGGSFKMGNAMLMATYGQGDDNDTYNLEYDAWQIAGAYSFSKRTMAYAGFNQVDADAVGEYDHFAVGMRHKF